MVAERSRDESRAKITNQFRKRLTMVYDLRCEDVRLTIEITPGEANESGDGRTWLAQARARQAPEQPTVEEAGATPEDALQAVTAAWVGKQGAYGFPPLDWNAVRTALHAVRAI